MSLLKVILIVSLIVESIVRDESSPLPETPRHFRRSEEGQEIGGYVEQCRPTNFWKGQLTRVNVFAFLDPSWYYSYRQTIMLEVLKKRLENSGFPEVSFFVVTPPSNLPEANTENNIEIKTWKEIPRSPSRSEHFLGIDEELLNNVTNENEGSLIFLRDTPELGIWENFRALRDEVVVVDRCGKLTYQVIIPWSILYFPYVKAAILSTYNDDPCGPCDAQTLTRDTLDYEEYLLKGTNSNTKEAETSFSANSSAISDTVVSEINYEQPKFDNTSQFDRNVSMESTQVEATSEINSEQEEIQMSTVISDLETTENYKQVTVDTNSSSMLENLNNESRIKLRKEDYNATNKSSEIEGTQIEKTEVLPLRIILYAPHLHKENQTLQRYTHLILEAGSPDYHDHFNNKNTIFDREPAISKNEPTLDNKKLAEYVDGVNERPGVYGEIADYWRSVEESNDNNENYDDTEADDIKSNIQDVFDSESSILRPTNIDEIDKDTTVNSNDNTNGFVRQQLMEHYNKLLGWIYYILS